MTLLALRNLLHDKVRFAVTLVGIVFSVVLVAVQTGLFLGFTSSTSNVIDNSAADFWVTSKGARYIEVGRPFSERKLYHALAAPGVAEVRKFIVWFSPWKRPDGANATCEIIGFDPDGRMGGPWRVSAGDVHDLKQEDTVMVDRFYAPKLGISHLGQAVEIQGVRARVVGFTEGIRTFTTSPLVFASFKNARRYAGLPSNQTIYLLVKARPGMDLERVKSALVARLPEVDVRTTREFSSMTTSYWMFGTGAGITVIVAAVLGLLVGIVVVAQTIYAATIDHIREYGTLKAMGATNGYIYRIILQQAAVSGMIGYAVGIAIAVLVAGSATRSGGADIVLPGGVQAGLFALTLLMCASAAIVSINKATRIDPAMVFRG